MNPYDLIERFGPEVQAIDHATGKNRARGWYWLDDETFELVMSYCLLAGGEATTVLGKPAAHMPGDSWTPICGWTNKDPEEGQMYEGWVVGKSRYLTLIGGLHE